MTDQRRAPARDLTMLWRALSMVAIAAVIVGAVMVVVGSLLAMPPLGLLVALVPVKRLLTGTVPAGRKRGKTW